MLVKPNIRRSKYSSDEEYVDSLYRELGTIINNIAVRIKYEICFSELYDIALSHYLEIQKYSVSTETIIDRPTYNISVSFPNEKALIWLKNGYYRKPYELVRFKLKKKESYNAIKFVKVVRTSTNGFYKLLPIKDELSFVMPPFDCTIIVETEFNYLSYTSEFSDYICAINTPVYSGNFSSFLCEQMLYNYISNFEEFICATTDGERIYSAAFTDYICEQIRDFSLYTGTFKDYICEQIEDIGEYYSEFTDFVCAIADVTYSSQFTGYMCEQVNYDYVSNFIDFVCATTGFTYTYSSQYTSFICEQVEETTPPEVRTLTLIFDANSGHMTSTLKFECDTVSINWGDGSIEAFSGSITTGISHTYLEAGTYYIQITDSTSVSYLVMDNAYTNIYMNEFNNVPELFTLKALTANILIGSISYLDSDTLPLLSRVWITEQSFTNNELADLLDNDTRTWKELYIYNTDLEYNGSSMPTFDYIESGGTELIFSNSGLSQTEVDALLSDILANDVSLVGESRTLDIRDNADPSAAGLVTISSLEANGWTVQYGESIT